MHQNNYLGGLSLSNVSLNLQASLRRQQEQSVYAFTNAQQLMYVSSTNGFIGLALPQTDPHQFKHAMPYRGYIPVVKQQNDTRCNRYLQAYQQQQCRQTYSLFENGFTLNRALFSQDALFAQFAKPEILPNSYFTDFSLKQQPARYSHNVRVNVPAATEVVPLKSQADKSKNSININTSSNDLSFTYFTMQRNVNNSYNETESKSLFTSVTLPYYQSEQKFANPFEAVPDMLRDVRPGKSSFINSSPFVQDAFIDEEFPDENKIYDVKAPNTKKMNDHIQLFHQKNHLNLTSNDNYETFPLTTNRYLITDDMFLANLHSASKNLYLGPLFYLHENYLQNSQQASIQLENKSYADVVQDTTQYDLNFASIKCKDTEEQLPVMKVKNSKSQSSKSSNSTRKGIKILQNSKSALNVALPTEKKKNSKFSPKSKKQANNPVIYYNDSWRLDKLPNTHKYNNSNHV